MAKTLAGVLAVSIAALLFAGCGGSSTAGGSDAAATQLLAQCATGYSGAATKMNEATDIYGAEMQGPTADTAKRNLATAIQLFNDEVSRLPCSEQVKADIRTQVEAGSVIISGLMVLLNSALGVPDMGPITAANANIKAATTLIRAALNLPPATGQGTRR
jgi:hypothetical protein